MSFVTCNNFLLSDESASGCSVAYEACETRPVIQHPPDVRLIGRISTVAFFGLMHLGIHAFRLHSWRTGAVNDVHRYGPCGALAHASTQVTVHHLETTRWTCRGVPATTEVENGGFVGMHLAAKPRKMPQMFVHTGPSSIAGSL